MSQFTTPFQMTFLLTLVSFVTPLAAAETKNAEQIAADYVDLVRELSEATSGDSTQVVETSAELLKTLAAKLADYEAACQAVDAIPDVVVRGDKRLVPKKKIIDVVYELGVAGERLRIAKAWGALSVREERAKLANARQVAKAQNRTEVARVYAEVQAKIQDRENAALQLWALASGQAYVRVTETYASGGGSSSRGRAATPLEAMGFVRGLQDRLNSPLQVAPPRFTRVRDIFELAALTKNKENSKAVGDLTVRVDGELSRLADIHAGVCRKVLKDGSEADKRHAMMSLGWWNGLDERKAIEAALEGESEPLKDAAFAALHRLRPSRDMLRRLANLDSKDVRREAAILAGECVGDTKGALEVVRDLTLDKDGDVRQSAYTSLNALLAISNSNSLRTLDFARQALDSQSEVITTDAIRWIASLPGGDDPVFADKRRDLLAPLSRHKLEGIRVAASEALR